MKDFDLAKKNCLDKLYLPDKSRKGDVDVLIIPLIDYINSLNYFYTTSSCSGRIMLLTEADKKPDVQWLFVSHEVVSEEAIVAVLRQSLPEDTIWLRQENMILHVACRTMDNANLLLKIARDVGLRRSGIIADSNIIIVEICSTEKMDVPLSCDRRLIVSEDYVRFAVRLANSKFLKGKEKLERLESEIRKILC